MKNRQALMLWLLAGLAGCKSEVQYPATFATGNLALDVVIAGAPAASRIEQVRVSIEGPTSRVLTVTPGSTQTIDGLAPGSYTVVLEGLTGGEVETFGERAGVNVTAGSNTTVTLTMNSFVPVLTGLSAQVTVDQNVVVQFNPVTGASSYMVEWATEAAFTNPQSTTTSSTTASIRASAAGSLFVRVRARNRLGSNGRPASGGPVTVTPPAGLQLGITVAGNGSGTVTSAPAGINCTLTSGASGGTCATTFALGTVVTLTAAPATGNTFGGWQNACTGTVLTCQVTLDQARQVTATFSAPTAQQLSVSGSGNGSGTVVSSPAGINCALTATTGTGTCATTFPFGSSVTLTASAATGHTFSGWAGACSGSATCQVTLDQARLVTAIFSAPGPQTLTVIGAGSGSGTVTSVPASLNCAINAGVASGSCTNSFAFNSTVTLTATPAANHGFTGWSGACTGSAPTCQVTLNQTRFVTATFTAPGQQQLMIPIGGNGSGTVTSSPAGINCTLSSGVSGGTCVATFAFGTVVTLTAAPATGNTFGGWQNACTGTVLTCQVTLDQARQVTATFTAPGQQQLTVNGNGNGSGSVVSTPPGIGCNITAGVTSGVCTTGFAFGAPVTLTASAATGHTFTGWSGACSGTAATCQVTLDQARSVTASFSGPQILTMRSAGSGAGTVTSAPAGINCNLNNGSTFGDCMSLFAFNSVVTLTAAAATSNTFNAWSGACSGTASTCQVTLDQARQVTATFTGPPQQLNVNGGGTGSGTVVSSPAGINCTITLGVKSGTCLATFPLLSTITLTATPASGHTFGSFSFGGCGTPTICLVLLDQNQSLTATFNAPGPQQLTLAAAGSGVGTVTSSPTGINCTMNSGSTSGTCLSSFVFNTLVTLTAAAPTGNSFAGWSGACSGTALTCQVTMSQAGQVTATFNGPPQQLNINPSGTGSGVVTSSPVGINCTITLGVRNGSCLTSFALNASITLTVSPASGHTFNGWTTNCTSQTATTCVLTLDQSRSVTVAFTAPSSPASDGTTSGGAYTAGASATVHAFDCPTSSIDKKRSSLASLQPCRVSFPTRSAVP